MTGKLSEIKIAYAYIDLHTKSQHEVWFKQHALIFCPKRYLSARSLSVKLLAADFWYMPCDLRMRQSCAEFLSFCQISTCNGCDIRVLLSSSVRSTAV